LDLHTGTRVRGGHHLAVTDVHHDVGRVRSTLEAREDQIPGPELAPVNRLAVFDLIPGRPTDRPSGLVIRPLNETRAVEAAPRSLGAPDVRSADHPLRSGYCR